MELNHIVIVLNRDKRGRFEKICEALGLRVVLTMMGRGTAAPSMLTLQGLQPSEKAIMSTVADVETSKQLFRTVKRELAIDIPGNGIIAATPIKSVGGANTLAYFTDQKPDRPEKAEWIFPFELIYVILNEGHSDEVMDAARPAGATGGTIVPAKGTGIHQAEKFAGLSLANEKEILMILTRRETKTAIMKAIIEKAGPQTGAGAICFSLPVTHAAGLRRLDDEEEWQTPKDAEDGGA